MRTPVFLVGFCCEELIVRSFLSRRCKNQTYSRILQILKMGSGTVVADFE
jgi:hypothetical protein